MDPDILLRIGDDELILGWRDSEWTGIAPFLEEDVALSSIAQNEIGHARALYQLAAEELGSTADELAFDRRPDEYRCVQLVELRLVPDWGATIARRVLYEAADALRVEALMNDEDERVAGLAAKIDREEIYHRMHADMWAERLAGKPHYEAALDRLWPHALAVVPPELRPRLADRFGRPSNTVLLSQRGEHTDELAPLWEEMTMVRRSVPGAAW